MNFQPLIAEILAEWPDLMAIYAFGSQVSGHAHDHSDLDLAVLLKGYIDPLKLFDVASKLAEKINCEVDLIDLRAASTVMQFQVIYYGQRLYGQNLDIDLFELAVISEKTSFDESRILLLNDIKQRGTIYGQ